MTYDPSNYDPTTTYSPTAPSYTANGVTGSQTSASLGNAAVQAKPAGGNPYADAIQHTANWMSYVSPTSALGAGKTAAPITGSNIPGVATIGTGDTIRGPIGGTGVTTVQSNGQTSMFQPSTTGNPETAGLTRDPNSTVPTTQTIADRTLANAKSYDGTIPTTAPSVGPVTQPPTGQAAPGYNAAEWGPKLTAAGAGNPDEIIKLANQYSQTPGFEWVDPMVVQQYRAAVARGGPDAGASFQEWAARNYQDKITPGSGGEQAGMRDWATRMRNEMFAKNPKADTAWVNADVMKKYDSWWRQNKGVDPATGRGLDFWSWADSINAGKAPGWREKPIGTPARADGSGTYRMPDGTLVHYTGGIPGQTWNGTDFGTPAGGVGTGAGGGGGARTYTGGSGAGGGGMSGGESTSSSGPQGGYSPSGQTYLDNLMEALKQQYGSYNEQQMREFRHNAGLGGMQNSGAYGTSLGNLQRQLLGDQNSNLAQVMAGQTDAERQRAAQIALGNISASASRYGADRGLDAANAGASASMYGSDQGRIASMFGSQLGYNQGIYGIDANRENNAMNSNLNWQQLALQYLQMMMGQSPSSVLGGYTPPTGVVVPHY